MEYKILSNIGKDIIDKAQNEYKNNFLSCISEQELYQSCPTLNSLVQNNPLLSEQIHQAFVEQRALQSALIGECVAVYVLAQYTHIDNYVHSDTERGKFVNDKNWQLIYYGDPSHNDINIISPDGHIIPCEIKSQVARAGDTDLNSYNIDGTTSARDSDTTIFSTVEGHLIIDAFNQWNLNWANIGSNFKLEEYPQFCTKISKQYFAGIMGCIIIYSQKIVWYRVNDDFFNIISYKGSEIRTTGKNHKKNHLNGMIQTWIEQNNCFVNNGIISTSLENIEPIKGKGVPYVTRYGLIKHLIFVFAKDCIIQDNTISFPINKIRTCTPNGSIHVTFKEVA